jgi:RHH-type transcriptional regulator, rel operon repressor / antitoxin RelB
MRTRAERSRGVENDEGLSDRVRHREEGFRADGLAVWQCIQNNTDMSEVITIRVDRKTKTRLEKLAKAMDRTKSYVAAEAIRAYVDLNEWQIGEIKAALKEADAGDFASEEEVQAVMRKWRRGAG